MPASDPDGHRVASGLEPVRLLAVFTGGCAGGLTRWAVTQAAPVGAHAFPWPTLAVNTAGAFALALLVALLGSSGRLPLLRPLLGTGFCGAFTTYGSIMTSTDLLLAHGAAATGLAYLVASLAAGLTASRLGLALRR